MPTHALPALPPVPRSPWRGLALLAAAVLLAHLALLGLAPMAVGPHPSPLANKFSTRTIVIAPPAAEPAAPPPAAAAKPPPKPARPRPVARPQAPVPAPESPAPAEAAGPDLTTQAPAETGVPAEPTPEAAAPAPAEGASAAAGSSAAGQAEAPVPQRIPGSVRLAFAATGQQGTSPMQGVFGNLTWLQDGRQYDAQLSLTFLFRTIRSQHSNGVIGANGIEPARFSDKRRNEVASHFMREQGTVVFSNNAPSVPLMPGAQDRLSVILQLGALMAGDPGRYPPGAAFAIQTVGPRDADIWIFKVEDDEKLSLQAGEFTARKLTRNPRQPFDDKVELWLAPELGYLPVRIKQTQSNGDFADLQLRSVESMRP